MHELDRMVERGTRGISSQWKSKFKLKNTKERGLLKLGYRFSIRILNGRYMYISQSSFSDRIYISCLLCRYEWHLNMIPWFASVKLCIFILQFCEMVSMKPNPSPFTSVLYFLTEQVFWKFPRKLGLILLFNSILAIIINFQSLY